MKKTRPASAIMLAILRDFARKPIKSRGEYSDGAGHVLKREIDHYDMRSFGALTSRGMIDYFKRCECEWPCDCGNNGWHITPVGVAELEAASAI